LKSIKTHIISISFFPFFLSVFHFISCGTSYFASQERFVWLDLTARPTIFGPVHHGDGMVNELNVPSLAYSGNKRDLQHDLSLSLGKNQSKEIKTNMNWKLNIVPFIEQTLEFLIGPSLAYYTPLRPIVNVALIRIHQFPSSSPSLLDWKAIERIVIIIKPKEKKKSKVILN